MRKLKVLSIICLALLAMVGCKKKDASVDFKVSPSDFQLDANDTIVSIALCADGVFTVNTSEAWLSVNLIEGEGFNAVTVFVEKNKSSDARSGFITIENNSENKVVTISQKGKKSISENWTYNEGAIKSYFSVSPTKKIAFAKGNLQYQASSKTWRIATDCSIVGNANAQISSTNTGWIDLFCWGTSGWDSGANEYQPYSISIKTEDFYVGGNYANHLTGKYENADWGVYNSISNGGNKPGMWRVLTMQEWRYLLNQREDADILYTRASVNGLMGFIFLPDNWTLPVNASLVVAKTNWVTNQYSLEQWAILENAGAVFFPLGSLRYGAEMRTENAIGRYWTSTYDYVNSAYAFNFSTESKGVDAIRRPYGCFVRLVQDLN